jgi:uncharacterized protein
LRQQILGIATAALIALGGTAAAQPIGIGTSPQGTLTYRLGATYAKTLEEAKIPARVQPSSGTGVMVPLVNDGEVDLGFVNTLELTEAFKGTGSFDKRPQKNLRTLAVLFPIRVGFFVRKDSPIRSVQEIKGKAIAYGYTSQEIIKTVVDGLLADAGLTAGDMKTVLVPNLIRGVDEFIAGKVEVGFFALGQAKVSEADAAVGGIRFLPLADDPAAVQAMKKVVPTAYLDTVQPAPNLAGVTGPLKTMFYDYTLFGYDKLPKDKVYRMVQTLIEQHAAMAAAMPLFKDFHTERAYRDIPVPYHEGALAYFKDKGIPKTE